MLKKSIPLILLLSTSLTGCSNIDKYVDAGVVGATGYVVGGPVVGVAVASAEVLYEELTPYNNTEKTADKIKEIKTPSQAIYASISDLSKDLLYAVIAFLLITNVLVPWLKGRRDRELPSKREEALVDLMMNKV